MVCSRDIPVTPHCQISVMGIGMCNLKLLIPTIRLNLSFGVEPSLGTFTHPHSELIRRAHHLHAHIKTLTAPRLIVIILVAAPSRTGTVTTTSVTLGETDGSVEIAHEERRGDSHDFIGMLCHF